MLKFEGVKINLLPRFLLIVVACLGILLSIVLAQLIYKQETQSIEDHFGRDFDAKVQALERGIELDLEALYALKSLHDNSTDVSQDEFAGMAQSLIGRHSTIQALEWVPRILRDERQEYERRRQESFQGFEIKQLDENKVMVIASERDVYFPVYFVEPVIGNRLALGFDLASNPQRKAALEMSRDSGLAQASSAISLVQGKGKGFLVFMPIYHGHPGVISQRREALKGFVLGVFRIDDIVNRAMDVENNPNFRLTLLDETDAEIDNLYRSTGGGDISTVFNYRRSVRVLEGRHWVVMAQPSTQYVRAQRGFLPYITAVVGFIFTLGAASYIFSILRINLKLNAAQHRLEELSQKDGLTRIANRRSFDERLAHNWGHAVREKGSLTLLMIDVDFFKQYNDHYGHIAGDRCLIRLAQCLETSVRRATDLVARYGGEEFVILLPNAKDPRSLAEAYCASIENLKILHESSSVAQYVTISVGLSTVFPDQNSQQIDLCNNADKALYEAKDKGRNQVCEINESLIFEARPSN